MQKTTSFFEAITIAVLVLFQGNIFCMESELSESSKKRLTEEMQPEQTRSGRDRSGEEIMAFDCNGISVPADVLFILLPFLSFVDQKKVSGTSKCFDQKFRKLWPIIPVIITKNKLDDNEGAMGFIKSIGHFRDSNFQKFKTSLNESRNDFEAFMVYSAPRCQDQKIPHIS